MNNVVITGAAGQLGKMVVAKFLNGHYHFHLLVTKERPVSDRETAYVTDLTDVGAVREQARDRDFMLMKRKRNGYF